MTKYAAKRFGDQDVVYYRIPCSNYVQALPVEVMELNNGHWELLRIEWCIAVGGQVRGGHYTVKSLAESSVDLIRSQLDEMHANHPHRYTGAELYFAPTENA